MLDHVKASSSQCGGSRGPTHGMVIRMGSMEPTDMADIAPGALGAADGRLGVQAAGGHLPYAPTVREAIGWVRASPGAPPTVPTAGRSTDGPEGARTDTPGAGKGLICR